jgi:probable F420-dependent oxidoreductase
MLAMVAAYTTTLRLQTGILVLPYRNPFATARDLATLDHFSGGRVTLSVGVGYLKGEYRAMGVPFDQRHELMDEYIRALRVSLTGEEFVFEGTGYNAFGNRIIPGPAQAPLPILCGGNAKRAIRRAADLCDGWNPFFTSNTGTDVGSTRTVAMSEDSDLADGIAYLNDYCAQIGRAVPPEVVLSGLSVPGRKVSSQELVDRAGRFVNMGVVAAGIAVSGRTRAEWCDDAERIGTEIIAKIDR